MRYGLGFIVHFNLSGAGGGAEKAFRDGGADGER